MSKHILHLPNQSKAATVETRLLAALQYLYFRSLGLSTAKAAKLLGWPSVTIWRHGQRLLAYGRPGLVPRGVAIRIPAAPPAGIPREKLQHVLAYLVQWSRGFPPDKAAERLPMSSGEAHELGQRLLQHGLAGLATDWPKHVQDQAELRQFDVDSGVVDQVERLAGELGDVAGAWKQFSRSRECPWRLSVYIRKRKEPPASLLRSVRIEPIGARAWRGGSGKIYVRAGSEFAVLPKRRRQRRIRHASGRRAKPRRDQEAK